MRCQSPRMGWEGRCGDAHPRSAKDVPILDLEMLAKTFDVFDQIPGRVFFQTRAPIYTYTQPPLSRFVGALMATHYIHARSRFSGSSLI